MPISTRARRLLAVAVAIAAAGVALTPQPAAAETGVGLRAYASTRVDDPNDQLRRAGNVHMIDIAADVNPEGVYVRGTITSYDCAPGQLLGDCDRVAAHRLVDAGPVAVTVKKDGSAQLTATVAEIRIRDDRQLREFDVNLAVTAGNLTARQNCTCTFSLSDGTTFVQRQFVKQWTGSTASGTVGVFPVAAGAGTSATSGKYWVKSSEPYQP